MQNHQQKEKENNDKKRKKEANIKFVCTYIVLQKLRTNANISKFFSKVLKQ